MNVTKHVPWKMVRNGNSTYSIMRLTSSGEPNASSLLVNYIVVYILRTGMEALIEVKK